MTRALCLALLLAGCSAPRLGAEYAQFDGAALAVRWHIALGDTPAPEATADDDSDDGDDE